MLSMDGMVRATRAWLVFVVALIVFFSGGFAFLDAAASNVVLIAAVAPASKSVGIALQNDALAILGAALGGLTMCVVLYAHQATGGATLSTVIFAVAMYIATRIRCAGGFLLIGAWFQFAVVLGFATLFLEFQTYLSIAQTVASVAIATGMSLLATSILWPETARSQMWRGINEAITHARALVVALEDHDAQESPDLTEFDHTRRRLTAAFAAPLGRLPALLAAARNEARVSCRRGHTGGGEDGSGEDVAITPELRHAAAAFDALVGLQLTFSSYFVAVLEMHADTASPLHAPLRLHFSTHQSAKSAALLGSMRQALDAAAFVIQTKRSRSTIGAWFDCLAYGCGGSRRHKRQRATLVLSDVVTPNNNDISAAGGGGSGGGSGSGSGGDIEEAFASFRSQGLPVTLRECRHTLLRASSAHTTGGEAFIDAMRAQPGAATEHGVKMLRRMAAAAHCNAKSTDFTQRLLHAAFCVEMPDLSSFKVTEDGHVTDAEESTEEICVNVAAVLATKRGTSKQTYGEKVIQTLIALITSTDGRFSIKMAAATTTCVILIYQLAILNLGDLARGAFISVLLLAAPMPGAFFHEAIANFCTTALGLVLALIVTNISLNPVWLAIAAGAAAFPALWGEANTKYGFVAILPLLTYFVTLIAAYQQQEATQPTTIVLKSAYSFGFGLALNFALFVLIYPPSARAAVRHTLAAALTRLRTVYFNVKQLKQQPVHCGTFELSQRVVRVQQSLFGVETLIGFASNEPTLSAIHFRAAEYRRFLVVLRRLIDVFSLMTSISMSEVVFGAHHGPSAAAAGGGGRGGKRRHHRRKKTAERGGSGEMADLDVDGGGEEDGDNNGSSGGGGGNGDGSGGRGIESITFYTTNLFTLLSASLLADAPLTQIRHVKRWSELHLKTLEEEYINIDIQSNESLALSYTIYKMHNLLLLAYERVAAIVGEVDDDLFGLDNPVDGDEDGPDVIVDVEDLIQNITTSNGSSQNTAITSETTNIESAPLVAKRKSGSGGSGSRKNSTAGGGSGGRERRGSRPKK